MHNNKFVSVLRTLSTKEVKAFAQFLEGLYAKQTVALKLFEFIRGFSPKFDRQDQMTLELAHQFVFGKKLVASDKKGRKNLLNSLSDLNQWLGEFLILQEVRKKKSSDRDLMLLKIYQDRNCRDVFSSKLKAFHKTLDQAEEIDVWHHWYRLRADHLLYYSNFSDKYSVSQSQFFSIKSNLEEYYLTSKLKYACEAINRQKVLKEDHLSFFEENELAKLTDREDLDI
ncbi:MAG: hypothetical protein AAF985_20275, partial [Bacteroidota bacterium]